MVFENEYILVEREDFEIPWLKIFAKKRCKEWSECDSATKELIFRALELIEKQMLAYFKPDKINIASFGNMVPQVHWHIQARFKKDSYFPNPVWGQKQRNAQLQLPDINTFCTQVAHLLKEHL